jgi:hypothetical protein
MGRRRGQERCRVLQCCYHGAGASCSGPSPCVIHQSAWKGNSQKFVFSCYCTDMKRDAAFWWTVVATISWAIIIFFMTVFVIVMFAQLGAGPGPAD